MEGKGIDKRLKGMIRLEEPAWTIGVGRIPDNSCTIEELRLCTSNSQLWHFLRWWATVMGSDCSELSGTLCYFLLHSGSKLVIVRPRGQVGLRIASLACHGQKIETGRTKTPYCVTVHLFFLQRYRKTECTKELPI